MNNSIGKARARVKGCAKAKLLQLGHRKKNPQNSADRGYHLAKSFASRTFG